MIKPIKFESTKNDDYLIIVCKSVSRIAHLKDMPWGDNQQDGQAYEYRYDVISNGDFFSLDENELEEALEDMKFSEMMQ